MPSPLRDPKSLPQWLELDYYRRPRALRRSRRVLGWTVLLLAAAAAAAVAFWPSSQHLYQAGPLSRAHAMFSADCASCHSQHFQTIKSLVPGHGDLTSVTDADCKQCHPGAEHNTLLTNSPGCATCHREHRGRILLSLVSDKHCTACHGSLEKDYAGKTEFRNVTSFAEHPDFRVWGYGARPPQSDTARLKFNHYKHTVEGVPDPSGEPGKRVTLDCARCHQTSAGTAGATAGGSPSSLRSGGRYMEPINYKQHCSMAGCHKLEVYFRSEDNEVQRKGGEEASREPAPHAEPRIIRAELRSRITDYANRFEVKEDKEKRLEWIDEQLKGLLGRLYARPSGQCMTCHEPKGGDAKDADGFPVWEKTDVPVRWLKHGGFSHDTHRLVKCLECHDTAPESKVTKDVNLPRIETCQQCHKPQAAARSDCVECHGYHDHAKEKDWRGQRSIEEVLKKH